MKIEFGQWLPDQPPLDNPGCTQAKNVIPRANAYSQLRALKSFSAALEGACLGAISVQDQAGNAQNFAGDSRKLYKYDGTNATWSNVSRTATYAAAVAWNFDKFGTRVIAADISNNPQFYDVSSGASTTFQNLGGSPPNAKYVATIRDFVVLANISGYPNRVYWSGFNNSELWTPSLSTQCDFQDLSGRGGDIQGVVPGPYGVIFQENSIWTMVYSGPPTIFQFDEVERGRGTPSPGSIVYLGGNVFFYDWSGFFRFDGKASTPIGQEKVDVWFEHNCGDYTSLQGALDRVNRIIIWGFKSTSAATYNDRILIYSFALDKWSWGSVTTQYIIERRTVTLTLDQLDAVLPLGVDLDSIGMDSRAFSSDLALQAFNGDSQACTFEGDPLHAVIETREIAFDEHFSQATAVMPLVDGDDPTITIRFARRQRQSGSATYSNEIGLNRIGEANRVINSRYQRFEVNIRGGFELAKGIDIRGRKAGRR